MDERALRAIRTQQRQWAESRGIEVDPDGLAPDVASNLLRALPAEARHELERDPTRPLGERGKPARLRALDATEALVLNVFGPWRSGEAGSIAVLAGACGADPRSTRMRFAAAGAQVVIGGEGARPTAVLATFAEPYAGIEGRLDGSELEPAERWQSLPGCRHLARDLVHGARRFRTLEAGRIVACARDWTRHFGTRGFRMLYLWYESEGAAARLHRRELDRLRMRIGGEVDFASRTWQALFAALAGEDVGYARELGARYFPRTRRPAAASKPGASAREDLHADPKPGADPRVRGH